MLHHSNTNAENINSQLSFKVINKTSYAYADELFFTGKIKGPVLHTLKALISCKRLKQPTMRQINAARNRSAARKFAQSNPVSDKTIQRHIKLLEELGFIIVEREHVGWDSRNAYNICIPDKYLVAQRRDIMSPSIPEATLLCSSLSQDLDHKHIRNEYDLIKEEEQMSHIKHMGRAATQAVRDITAKQGTHPVFMTREARAVAKFNPDEIVIYDKLVALGIYKNLAVKWVNTHSVAELNNLIESCDKYKPRVPHSYLSQCISQLHAAKATEAAYVPAICLKPWEPGAVMTKSQKPVGLSAIKKLKELVRREKLRSAGA
jgi:hypothetical protein